MESSRYPAYYKYVILVVCSVFLAMVYVTLSTWGVCSPIFQEKFQLSSALAMAGHLNGRLRHRQLSGRTHDGEHRLA